jgi:hypothetical protein
MGIECGSDACGGLGSVGSRVEIGWGASSLKQMYFGCVAWA